MTRILLQSIVVSSLAACSGHHGESPGGADSSGGPTDSSVDDSSPTDTGPFDDDSDGYVAADDCDDADATVHPGADEHCDGRDEDCDSIVDEDAVDAPSWYVDLDGDGWGSGAAKAIGCTGPSGLVDAGDDCDDDDATVHPEATEICDNQRDEDCVPGGDDDCRAMGNGNPFDYFTLFVSGGSFPTANPGFLNDLATGADVDGDGRADLLMGMPMYPGRGYTTQTGAVLVLDGNLDAAGSSYDDHMAMILGDSPQEFFGDSVIGLGDLDGDGFGDIAVGDVMVDDGMGSERVAIFHGPLSGRLKVGDADYVLEHDKVSSFFGADLAAFVADDGTTQIAVGAKWDYYDGIERYGGVYVLDPSGDGDLVVGESENIALYTGEENLANPGTLIHDLGDTNGDGVSDLAISCTECSNNGIVYIELGPHDGESSLADADTRLLHGIIFGPTGDTDGDGFADLAITQVGAVDLYTGPLEVGAIDMTAEPGTAHMEPYDGFQIEDLTGADVDGDGFSDLAIPDSTWSDFYLFYGPVSGSRSLKSADLHLTADLPDFWGHKIESFGDADDDGHEDLIVSDNDGNLDVMLGEGI